MLLCTFYRIKNANGVQKKTNNRYALYKGWHPDSLSTNNLKVNLALLKIFATPTVDNMAEQNFEQFSKFCGMTFWCV